MRKMIALLLLFGMFRCAGRALADSPAAPSGAPASPQDQDMDRRHRELEAEIRQKLDEIDRNIGEIQQKAESSETSVKGQMQQRVQELQQMKPVLASRLADLDIAWSGLRTSLEQTADELQKAMGCLESGTSGQIRR